MRRNEKIQEMNARRRLRPRIEDAESEVELARMRTEVRNARKGMKEYMRGLERDWWNERMRVWENACAQRRLAGNRLLGV